MTYRSPFGIDEGAYRFFLEHEHLAGAISQDLMSAPCVDNADRRNVTATVATGGSNGLPRREAVAVIHHQQQ